MKLAVGLILLLVTTVHAAPSIEVKPFVKISSGSTIKLADVASYSGLSKAQEKKLGQVILGDVPPLGEKRVFTSRAISEVIRRQLNTRTRKIVVKIPSRVTIANTGYELDQAQVEKRLIRAWKAECSECRFIFHSLSMPILPERVKGLAWQLKVRPGLPKGSLSVPLHVQTKQGKSQIFWVTGQVEIQKKVPVATRAVTIGHRIQPDDFEYKYQNVTFTYDGIPRKKDLLGQRLRRSLRANDVIWMRAVERDKALRRGQLVQVTSGDESFQVSIRGIADQDGFIGDMVNVKHPVTNKRITGIVTGRGQVLVK